MMFFAIVMFQSDVTIYSRSPQHLHCFGHEVISWRVTAAVLFASDLCHGQTRSQVLRFCGHNTFLGGQEFCFYYMLNKKKSGHKNFGASLPPNSPPWLRAWYGTSNCALQPVVVQSLLVSFAAHRRRTDHHRPALHVWHRASGQVSCSHLHQRRGRQERGDLSRQRHLRLNKARSATVASKRRS